MLTKSCFCRERCCAPSVPKQQKQFFLSREDPFFSRCLCLRKGLSPSLSQTVRQAHFCVLLFSLEVVKYPERLDLGTYMSEGTGGPLLYTLYAVLVHEGFRCQAGHYYCFVKVNMHLVSSSVEVRAGEESLGCKPSW